VPALVYLASLVPGILYLWLIYRLDRYEPEPKSWVALIFFLGMAAAVVSAAAHEGMSHFIPVLRPASEYTWDGELDAGVLAIRYLCVVAPTEELLKLLAFLPALLTRRLINEPVDGLVYAGAAALGFASLENAVYALERGADLIVMRAILAVPMHLLVSACWGLGLSFSRLVRGGWTGRIVVTFTIVIAVLGHGLYDVLVHVEGKWAAAVVLLVLVALVGIPVFILRERTPFRTSDLPEEEKNKLAYCPSCGGAGHVEERCEGCKVRLVPLFDDSPGTPPLRIAWVLIAILAIGGGTVGAALLGFEVGRQLSMSLAGMVVLVGATVIGRLSPGVTVAEPAVAGMVATVAYIVVMGGQLGAALILSPIGLLLAVIGAWAGERWQSRAQERARAASTPD